MRAGDTEATTLREHMRAIAYGNQLVHEDELIDLYQQHAVTALKILDDARKVGGKAADYPGAPKPRQQHRLILDPQVES